MGKVTVVGIGPGSYEDMTIRADTALRACDAIVGYPVYVDLVRDRYPGKELHSTPMTREAERCQLALELARSGKTVAMVCSGDSGIYGMAALVYELRGEAQEPEIQVVPGLTAACSAAAVLAVTTAGYVRTRVARVRTGLSRENAAALAALLNRNLTFVAPVDLSPRLLAELCSQISPELVPVISAAAAILQDSTQPHVYLGGEQYLLDWPQLDGKVGSILSLLNDEEQAAALIAPPAEQSESILLGEDLEPQIPGLCIVSDRYLVGGGLWGSVALIGPTRMPFQKLMPLLHTFADQLGEGMSGKRKDTPQAAAPRRTVIYKEDLE